MINRSGPIPIQSDKLNLPNSMRELEPGDRRRRSFEGLKALHRPALHLDGAMILFDNIVEVFARTHFHPTPSRMLASKQAQCAMAGLMAVECQLQGAMAAMCRERFAEERLGCRNAAGTAQIKVDRTALLIHRAI